MYTAHQKLAFMSSSELLIAPIITLAFCSLACEVLTLLKHKRSLPSGVIVNYV